MRINAFDDGLRPIYQIPNVRWGDERAFSTKELPEAVVFVGIPCDSIVSVGTYGCSQIRDEKKAVAFGFYRNVECFAPSDCCYLWALPRDVFCEFPYEPKLLQFDNWDKEMRLCKRQNLV